MTQYILRRLIHSIFIIWGCATLVFFLLRLVPGDPVVQMLGPEYTPEAAEALRRKLGLDEPVYVQYVRWFGNVLTGDLGGSIASGETVTGAIATGLPKTLSLAALSFLIAITIAIPAGIVAALRRNSAIDYGASILAFVGVSMPSFWFGIILILLFAVRLGWLPTSGYGGLQFVILPALALAFRPLGRISQVVRSAMLDQFSQPYVTTARAKGLTERVVVYLHTLKNAAIPVATLVGDEAASLLNGAVVIETVFGWPGVGILLIQAIERRDLPLIEACVIVIAVMIVTVNLLIDLTYSFLDPRVRYG